MREQIVNRPPNSGNQLKSIFFTGPCIFETGKIRITTGPAFEFVLRVVFSQVTKQSSVMEFDPRVDFDQEDLDGYGNEYGDYFGQDEDESADSCSDTYVVSSALSSSPAYFCDFSVESFTAIDLESEDGWTHGLIALEGYMEWCSANCSDASVCKRSSILLQCLAIMVENLVSTPFRIASKLYLLSHVCYEWAEFFDKFVELDSDGKVFNPFCTRADV